MEKMTKLLTPQEVAEILNISVEAVYKHKRALCGLYPAGIKVLRFREDIIYGIIQNTPGVEVRISKEREEVQWQRLPDQNRGTGSQGSAPKRGRSRQNPGRHGL